MIPRECSPPVAAIIVGALILAAGALASLLLLASVAPAHAADVRYVLKASPHAFNRIVLPEPFEQVAIPPQHAEALADEPIRTNADRGFLLLPREDAEPFEAVIELAGGETFILRIETDPALVRGQVFRYRGAVDVAPAQVTPQTDRDRWLHNTFVAAIDTLDGYETTIPGFESGRRPRDMDLPPLRLTGAAAWRDNHHRLNAYRLTTEKALDIAPPDFYRDGVVAVYIDREHITPGGWAWLLILEERDE